ncbi:Thermosome subunit alpha protein [Halorhabdus tiamatea SARL4B]|uniref:Thermosome subunit alpha protein n=1 Tax=Halorhabdus tiamatea SARL4B TaxID=1033806 RepID=U2F700_9EURY|nr:thermosome subunit alpha [Halorhabdus tiamatea]ERJ05960.1 Thermosome subunit alpha protein [Halorhabdus tiamatea SARL4B]
MAQQAGDRTLSVLSEESQRIDGRDARSMNLTAAQAMGEAVRTTLGPRGMDKMLVDSTGNVVVTNDGVTILDEMEVEHPAANMVVEVAQSQEQEVGDGTTSAVIFTGALLEAAEDLLERDVHPTTIAAGFEQAGEHVPDILDASAIDLDVDDVETLEAIASTAMTGKGSESEKEHLTTLVVDAIQTAVRDDGTVERDAVSITSFPGGNLADSRLVEGVTIDKNPAHDAMPTDFEDADVLVYEGEIEVPELETSTETRVSDFEEVTEYLDQEQAAIQEDVEAVLEAGADVLVTEGGIDDPAQELLAEADVMALRRVDDEDRRRLAEATGANRVSDLEAATTDDLGQVGSVDCERIRMPLWRGSARAERITAFTGVERVAGTIVLRGGTEHVVDEVERALEDSLDVLAAAIEDNEILPGAGAVETELALALEDAADGIGGREQLAVEAFAEAMDVSPRTLAENAGHSPIDALVDLRARHHDGERTVGIDAETGDLIDAAGDGIVEPRRVKETAIDAAIEAARTILRIDDVVSAGDLSTAGDDGAGM